MLVMRYRKFRAKVIILLASYPEIEDANFKSAL